MGSEASCTITKNEMKINCKIDANKTPISTETTIIYPTKEVTPVEDSKTKINIPENSFLSSSACPKDYVEPLKKPGLKSSSSSGLSGGAVAGIVIACVAVVGAAVASFFICSKNNGQQMINRTDATKIEIDTKPTYY